MKGWNESSACSARSILLACLNWGVAEGHIDVHPLGRLKRGAHRRRDRVLTPQEREKIRKNVKPEFHDFLFALEQTGARPFSELAPLTAAMIDWQTNTITLKDHKNAGKGKTRTLYLTPAMIGLSDAYVRRWALRNRPVCDARQAAISSGVPVATTAPPACPPFGPRSIT